MGTWEKALAQPQTGEQETQHPGREGKKQSTRMAEGSLTQQLPASSPDNDCGRLIKMAKKAAGDTGQRHAHREIMTANLLQTKLSLAPTTGILWN